MKLSTLISASLLSILLLVQASAQQTPNVVLVDEFGRLGCDDQMARLDHFFVELANNTDSQGFIAIASSPKHRIEAVFQVRMIERYTRFRRFDIDRLKIVRTSGSNELNVKFWRLPVGAAEPEINVDSSFEIAENTTPFIFASEEEVGQVECAQFDVEIFAQFLKANPEARANLVFRDRSTRKGQQRAKEVLSELTGKYEIAKIRIRTFFVKPRPDSYEPITEFWYLP